MKPVFSNDRKAPRMRKGEFSKMVITRELFTRFKKEFPEHKSITWQVFISMWGDIAAKIRTEAIHNPLGVKLGFHCGELKLQYIPYKMNIPDQKGSQELGEVTYYVQLETRGKIPRIKWERREAVKRNKILQYYAFDATREINKIAFEYIQKYPDKLRMSMVTTAHRNWAMRFKQLK